jgi:hypothetical protein
MAQTKAAYIETRIMKWLEKLPLSILLLLAVAPGLAPFMPEPHIWEKLKMLAEGNLVRPIDIFDLFLHGTPFVLLALKLYWMGMQKKN